MLSDSGQRKARGISPGVKAIEKALSFRSGLSLEAPSGFEPENRGFAVPCLTTWLWRRRRFASSGYNLGPAGVGQDFHLPKQPPLKTESRFGFVWEEEDGFQFVLQVTILPLRGWGKISTFRNTLLSKLNLDSVLYGTRKMDFNNNIAAKTSGCSLPSRSRTEL